MKFSADARFLVGVYETQNFPMWFLDRETGQTTELNIETIRGRSHCFFGNSYRLAAVSKSGNLELLTLPEAKIERTLPLPQGKRWSSVKLSPDGSKAVVFESRHHSLVLIDLDTGETKAFELETPLRDVAWRPDGLQFAIATDVIQVWDVAGNQFCVEIPRNHSCTTHLYYNANGRLLLSSGWDHVTQVFDSLSGREVMRCDALLQDLSADGSQLILHSGSRFQRRPIISSDVVTEFRFGKNKVLLEPEFDPLTGTLWLGCENQLWVADVYHRRVMKQLPSESRLTQAVVDPKSRDIFCSLGSKLWRLPVKRVADDRGPPGPNGLGLTIGPAEPVDLPGAPKASVHTLGFGAEGNKLGVSLVNRRSQFVLKRELNWQGRQVQSDSIPVRVQVNSRQPLLATSSHHAHQIEVRDTENGEVKFVLRRRQCNTNFTPDGKRLVIGADAKIQIYDTENWELQSQSDSDTWFDGGTDFVISHDGQWLAADLREPRGVGILDSENLQLAMTLCAHPIHPKSTIGQFDSTGRWLVTARGEEVIGIWDFRALRREFEKLGLPWPLGELGTHDGPELAPTVRFDWE